MTLMVSFKGSPGSFHFSFHTYRTSKSKSRKVKCRSRLDPKGEKLPLNSKVQRPHGSPQKSGVTPMCEGSDGEARLFPARYPGVPSRKQHTQRNLLWFHPPPFCGFLQENKQTRVPLSSQYSGPFLAQTIQLLVDGFDIGNKRPPEKVVSPSQ